MSSYSFKYSKKVYSITDGWRWYNMLFFRVWGYFDARIHELFYIFLLVYVFACL